MGVCVSLLAHQGLFVPRISLAFHCKPREHVCRVGEAGHFAINAGGLRRSVIEFRHRRSCFFTTLSVSSSITLAITLPTSRLSPALPTAPVDSFASTGPAASGGIVAIVRQVLPFARPVAALLIALACASAGTAVMAQTPKPINPGTSVTQTPLIESGAQDAAAQAASGVPASRGAGQVDTSGATDATGAQATADTKGFSARQKVLDVRSAENNYTYGVKQHNCYSDFFVNHCLDKARDAKREVAKQIRSEQLALDDEQRLLHAQQRDQQTALKRAQYASEAPQRAASEKASQESFEEKQRQNALSAAQRTAEAPQRAANQADYDRKQADYQKKLADAAARGVQDAKEREDKAERFAAKQRDAAEHQAEVQSRQKEAAAKQQQRAQQDAADQAHQAQLKQQQQQQQQQQQPK
jgi:DNA segregation ATPase FtsK/SpoIIIE-like protein